MKKVFLLALLLPVMASGQIMEFFESDDISRWIQIPEGRWNCDNIDAISGTRSLHHCFDNPGSGLDCAGLRLNDLYPGEGPVKWSIKVRHGTEPSSLNNWTVFLVSDSDPGSVLSDRKENGYAIGVNQTGNDDLLQLWRVTEGAFIPVIISNVNWQSDIGTSGYATIDVERSPAGRWEMKIFRQNGSMADSCSESNLGSLTGDWFVICYRYTSARDRLLWIDDILIEGVFHNDISPPALEKCEIAGKNSLVLSFSEEPGESVLQNGNFRIGNSDNQVVSVNKLTSRSVLLEFEYYFTRGETCNLIIGSLCDKRENCTENVNVQFSYQPPGTGDIIFSEIMADPAPAVSLPAREYLEIYNRTSGSISLKNWNLATETQNYPFPPVVIGPHEYMILCQMQDTSLFRAYGRVAGMKNFPALTDAGKIIALTSSSGDLTDGIEYSSDWYRDILKSEGGWSLEIIDMSYPFSSGDNWRASVSRTGGTPGRENSVAGCNPDVSFIGVTNVFPEDSMKISLSFSETVPELSAEMISIGMNGSGIQDLTSSDKLLRRFLVVPAETLKRKQIYSLEADDRIRDYAGNTMQVNSFMFGLPMQAATGDVIFSELLFNPLPGGADYIEFYNCSDKIIDVSRLGVVSVSTGTSDTSGLYYLSQEHRCLLPGEYYAITSGRRTVCEGFISSEPERIFEVSSMPSMPDKGGHLILLNRQLDVIDEVFYDDAMHFSLLGTTEGVALERTRLSGLSSDRTLWHSASETSGWGTPGAPNSAVPEHMFNDDQVTLSTTRITPDNDGNQDWLEIGMKFRGNGNIVSVAVFDEYGGFVRKLADNLLAGTEATIMWDCTVDNEKLVSPGVYILLVTVFNDAGKVKKWKKVCTVIR